MTNTNKKIGVILVGGTGYGAKEFLRLSESHPEIEIVQITSQNNSAKKISEFHLNSVRFANYIFESEVDLSKLKNFQFKFMVLALPYESSVQQIEKYWVSALEQNIKIIDLSGACRLKTIEFQTKHYPDSSRLSTSISKSFEYGLPEIYRTNIKKCQNVANPGCFATATILGLAPIANLKIKSIAVDGKSGTSGAGKSPSDTFHHPEISSSAFAYKVGGHRHQPEMEENLKLENNVNFSFCPHVIPISRGMLITSYVFLEQEFSETEISKLYSDFAKNSPFVRLRKSPPKIHDVVGSNFCDIYVKCLPNALIISSAIDNLTKGMAGQAIQNINIMSELPETTGLLTPGIGLV